MIIQRKRAQASLEYMLLAVFVLVLLTGLIILSSKELGNNTSITQAEDFVINVANAADEVYSLGEGARKFIYVRMPGSVESVNVHTREINIKFYTKDGLQEIYRTTKGNMTGEIDISSKGSISKVIVEMQSDNMVIVNST